MRCRSWTRLAVAGLLLVLSVFHFVQGARNAGRYGFVDLPIFLAQAREFLLGGELYVDTDDPQNYVPAAAVYKFPPLFAMSLFPLVHDGIDDGDFWLHWSAQLLFYAAAVAVALALLRRRGEVRFILVGGLLALNYEPFFETLWRLQLETPLLLLLTLALLLFARGRPGGVGAALGIGAMLKLYPAFLLLYFGLRRRWAVVAWTLATVVLLLISGLIVVGLEENRTYFLEVLPLMTGEMPETTTENLAVARYLQQWLGIGPLAAKRSGQLFAALLIVISSLVVYRSARGTLDTERTCQSYALFIPLMLLAMPNYWVNYQLLLLLPLLVLLRYCASARRNRLWLWGALGIAYVPTLFYWPCEAPSVPWPCARTPHFLGLVQLPRGLHDAMADLRVLTALVLWGALLFAVCHPTCRDQVIPD